ncbi:MAG TPA: TonB-dependent receptor [Longimicrobium sp.]|jgi:hypothetical protein
MLMLPALLLASAAPLRAQQQPVGDIKGAVTDAATREPLAGVSVTVVKTGQVARTDARGEFTIRDVSAGSYSLGFQGTGYQQVYRADVVVRPARITTLAVELAAAAQQIEGITVSAGYFERSESEPLSTFGLAGEEVRRAAGVGGDISRLLSVHPAMAQVSDERNDLLVRGGSSIENRFLINNIPVPSINHFPNSGGTGGPIGMVNTDLIRDVQTSVGGFSARHGDRLSSVTEIQFRDGNRDEVDAQLDMNMAGLGGGIEGPFAGGRGSWLITAKRSYLDLLVGAIGTGVAPRYSDVQGTVTYDLDRRNTLQALYLVGQSDIEWGKEDVTAEDARTLYGPTYGRYEAAQNTFGVNWRRLWGGNGYSQTSLSRSFMRYQESFRDWIDDSPRFLDDNRSGVYTLRNVNSFTFGLGRQVEFGVEGSYDYSDVESVFGAEERAPDGMRRPELRVGEEFEALKTGAFASTTLRFGRLTTTAGARGDYFSVNRDFTLAPRISGSFAATDRLSLNAAYGIYYQTLPLYVLAQAESNHELPSLKAAHYVAGLQYLVTPDTRLSLEVYDKQYSDFPLDSVHAGRFPVDHLAAGYGSRLGALEEGGRAYSRGVELMLQKKLAERFYGTVSGALFRSRYQGHDGTWRDRIYDNRYLYQVIAGYKPNPKWEMGARWSMVGGVPYTPADLASSRSFNRMILDESRVNAERLPAYHSLHLRMDRRFNFRKSSLVTFFSVSNVYNRQNIRGYIWNSDTSEIQPFYQWGLLPVGGFEFEF